MQMYRAVPTRGASNEDVAKAITNVGGTEVQANPSASIVTFRGDEACLKRVGELSCVWAAGEDKEFPISPEHRGGYRGVRVADRD